jgi:hypothetical protein
MLVHPKKVMNTSGSVMYTQYHSIALLTQTRRKKETKEKEQETTKEKQR